ncbi:O-antigen ligase family protein [Deinococcus sp. VB142]|uniref:O-antigen ligase family protein n=1 Tax=Deinococcus sp. VB142 TaxID=3112952 RepID=A0AAU6PZ08_9DEIO
MSNFDDAVHLPKEQSLPRWIAPWLALLPPLYVISPLALLGLPHLKNLPDTALWVLGFYALSQQLPALLAPEPVLASALALSRTLLMFGLMGVGVALGESKRLWPLALGIGAVLVTALGYSAVESVDFLVSRLAHPYMTPITLGLAGAFSLWLALFLPGKMLWRVPLSLGALGVLLLSGSRGPLAAALVGSVVGLMIVRGHRVAIGLLLGSSLLLAGFHVGDRLGFAAVSRLGSADTTGRDIVWADTLSIIQAYPTAGVGSYRLGRYLAPPGNTCTLFPDVEGAVQVCPEWIEKLGTPWLIAHNAALQQLAETGPLGLLGLFVLLAGGVAAAWQNPKRSALAWAILTGLLVATINDNTLLVPSPFFAELFWLVLGMQLVHLRGLNLAGGLVGAGLALALSLPIWGGLFGKTENLNGSISFLNAPAQAKSAKDYMVYVQFSVPPGDYRVSLSTCPTYCQTIQTLKFKGAEKDGPILTLRGDVLDRPKQRLELKLLTGGSSLGLRPLGLKTWELEVAGGQP